jgi:hypothetical protein
LGDRSSCSAVVRSHEKSDCESTSQKSIQEVHGTSCSAVVKLQRSMIACEHLLLSCCSGHGCFVCPVSFPPCFGDCQSFVTFEVSHRVPHGRRETRSLFPSTTSYLQCHLNIPPRHGQYCRSIRVLRPGRGSRETPLCVRNRRRAA